MADEKNTKVSFLAENVHVFPDFHGNRTPFNDVTLRGMVCGLAIDDSLDSLCILYLAAVQSLALECALILEHLRNHTLSVDTILACGGDTKNQLFLEEHANACNLPVFVPDTEQTVALGAAILACSAVRNDKDKLTTALE